MGAASLVDDPTTQAAPEPLTKTIYLPDWGIGDVADVRLGQFSVIDDAAGDRLEVYVLRDEEPREVSARTLSETPAFDGESLLVTDFRTNRNRLGGFFSEFQRAPSQAAVTLGDAPDGRPALRLSYSKDEDGFCGFWLHLFDFTSGPAERRYLNARPFHALGFWVRGAQGGEQILLKIGDAEWERNQDALPVAKLDELLPEGRLETHWQRVVVPLTLIPPRVSTLSLASVVFEVLEPGSSEIYLGPLAFLTEGAAMPPLPEPDEEADRAFEPASKATWVWNTGELLADEAQRDELLRLLAAERFDRVFLQLPEPADNPLPLGELRIDERLRPLLAGLNAASIEVYALDGHPAYALPAHHAAVLHTIEHVIDYNARVSEAERFHGIRHDIEPYLLPGFHGARRAEILRGFLELVAAGAERARGAGLVYGVDLPFWYDAPDKYTHEPISVEFGGARKLVSRHVIDLADDVSIMDYRTAAYGADGTIRDAEGELQYAAARGKQVFVGLETSPLPDEVLFELAGRPQRGLPEALREQGIVVLAPRGDSALVMLLADDTDVERSDLREWLADRLRREAVPSGAAVWWQVRRRISVPGDKLSFANLGPERLRQTMQETAREFRRYDSFAGFALHHFWSYKGLIGAQQ
ncbi:MAG: hypothetical protein JSU87_14500 [Gemmatimonadota bacterium]|nr:MAG: hypothetical protein JSU87_14500 [Gemmatimonadota bacterium]